MQNVPSGFLCDVNIGSKLHGRYAFLMTRYEIHGEKPFHEGYLGILEYGSNEDGEVLATMIATIRAVLASGTMVLSAERADDIILLPTRVADITAATFLAVEVGSQLDNAVEVTEVYHKNTMLRYLCILYTQSIVFSYKKSREK